MGISGNDVDKTLDYWVMSGETKQNIDFRKCFFGPSNGDHWGGRPLVGFQVRTIQEAEGSETLCVVFSGGAKAAEVSEVGTQSSAEKISSKISKVKMYVEGMEHDSLAQKKGKKRGVRDDFPYL